MFRLRQSSVRRQSRRGAVVVLVAVSLAAVLAFVAIAVDGGGLLDRRRKAQSTADAAALAAAEVLFRTYPTTHGLDLEGQAEQSALSVAAANGFTNDGTNSIVDVRTHPEMYAGGPNEGTTIPAGCAEVTVQYNQQRYFSGVIGSGTIPVVARAVARGTWEPAYVAIHVLDLHRSASLSATGESSITVTGASVIVNSDASDAASSSGGTVTASPINITGGTSVSGNKGGFFGDINYGTPPEPDPLRHIPEPTANGQTVQSQGPLHMSNGTRTLQPGTYRGGISVSGKGSLVMEPGVYYMDGGGFSFSGQGDLLAQGVMIFNAPRNPVRSLVFPAPARSS